MSKHCTILFLGLAVLLGFFACSNSNDGDPSPTDEKILPLAKVIAFSFNTFSEPTDVKIDHDKGTITITVPYGSSLLALIPSIVLEDGCTISPASGVAADFSQPIKYTVTGIGKSAQSYIVTVLVAKDTKPESGKGIIKGTVEEYCRKNKIGLSSNATVQLLDANKKVLQTTKTDKIGAYQFANLAEGSYSIKVVKDGFHNKPYRRQDGPLDQQIPKYTLTATNTTATAAIYTIYKKATVGIESFRWYQGYKPNGSLDGIHLDITFTNWTPSDGDVSLYLFAGFNENISKYNFSEKLSKGKGIENGWTIGYIMGTIPAREIVNGKVTGYREMSICGWLGGSLYDAKPRETHIAVYTANFMSFGVDGLTDADQYYEIGDEYSGISNYPPYVRKR